MNLAVAAPPPAAASPAAGPAPAPLMPLDDALQQLLAQAQPLAGTEVVPTLQADGRVLAQDCVAALQVPPLDNTAMDGYAVRCADVPGAGGSLPVVLPVSQRIAAGHAGQPLAAGTAARIFTGAPMPAGADAIIAQEQVQQLDSTEDGLPLIRIAATPRAGQWIRRSGEDVRRGTVVLSKGERLTPASLGLAASLGLNELSVAARPRVALFSTGDELVTPGAIPPEKLPAGAIYNANRYFLHALLMRLGCQVTDLGTVPDRRNATVLALKSAAREHDLILTSGGVSVGEEDHIKPAVQQLGELALWQIAMKPGKAFVFGHVRRGADEGNAHFIGLPGNPVSSFITFLLLVRPFVLRLQGSAAIGVKPLLLRANFALPRAQQRREFLRVRRNAQGGLDLFANQSSGVLTSAVWADGLVDNPAGRTIAQGDLVTYWPFGDLLA